MVAQEENNNVKLNTHNKMEKCGLQKGFIRINFKSMISSYFALQMTKLVKKKLLANIRYILEF